MSRAQAGISANPKFPGQTGKAVPTTWRAAWRPGGRTARGPRRRTVSAFGEREVQPGSSHAGPEPRRTAAPGAVLPAGRHIGLCWHGTRGLASLLRKTRALTWEGVGGDQESSHPKIHTQPRTVPTTAATTPPTRPPAC